MSTEESKLITGFVTELCELSGKKYSKKLENQLRNGLKQKYVPWIKVLGADTFAYSGSDLYYTYNQFLKHHKKYDKCIVVITSPIRYSTNIDGWMHCASIEDAKEGIQFATDKATKKVYETLVPFFDNIYYKDLERIELLNKAMLDSIKATRPDTIFVEAFPDLKRVFDLELKTWGISFDESQDYTKYVDLRHCHMTNDNNRILGEYILKNIDNPNIDISSIQWKTPTLEDKEYHLIKTQDLFTWLL